MATEAQIYAIGTCAIACTIGGILTILNILVALYLSRVLYKSTPFMQNKPNFKNSGFSKSGLAFQNVLCHFWRFLQDLSEVVNQNPFDFVYRFLIGIGKQCQIAQGTAGLSGQSDSVREICLAVPADKAVGAAAEIKLVARGS